MNEQERTELIAIVAHWLGYQRELVQGGWVNATDNGFLTPYWDPTRVGSHCEMILDKLEADGRGWDLNYRLGDKYQCWINDDEGGLAGGQDYTRPMAVCLAIRRLVEVKA